MDKSQKEMVIKAERKKLKKEELAKILAEFKNKLRGEGVPAQQFWLFGSYAAGAADADSDVDVAVILSAKISGPARQKLYDIPWWAKQVHVKLEPHVLSANDFKNRWLSLPAEIKKRGVKV